MSWVGLDLLEKLVRVNLRARSANSISRMALTRYVSCKSCHGCIVASIDFRGFNGSKNKIKVSVKELW